MKKKTIFIVLAVIIIYVVMLMLFNSTDYVVYINRRYSVNLNGYDTLVLNDTHSGFFGDGRTVAVFDLHNSIEREKLTASWKDLPFTENLELIMYGGEKNGMEYGYLLAEENGIPKITNGKYYFYDNQHETTSDEHIFDSPSFNFAIFIVDNDAEKLYFLEFDT